MTYHTSAVKLQKNWVFGWVVNRVLS